MRDGRTGSIVGSTGATPGVAIALLGVLSLSVGGCEKSEAVAGPPPPPVNVVLPVQRAVQEYDEFSGRVAAVESIDIRSRVSGYIQQVGFKDGEEVSAGQMLFQIDPRPFQADLNQAKAQLDQAQAELDYATREVKRIEPLAKTGAASATELSKTQDMFDRATASIAKAKAEIERKQLDVDYASVKSPIEGRVSTAAFTVGNLVGGDTLLTSVVSITPVYVNIDVDERRMAFYREEARRRGQANPKNVKDAKLPIFVAPSHRTDYPHSGIIDFVDNQVDPLTGTIRVRGLIDNADRMLTPGQFVRARFPRGEPAQTVLVPDRAVSRDQDRKFVLCVDDKNVVEYRPVETGGLFGEVRAILKGLKPDERIVLDGIQRARPGQPVTPTLVSTPTSRPSAAPTNPTTSPDVAK